MIGNIDYIIDNVSAKYGIERRIVEVIANESFKRLKKQQTNSEALSLYFPQLGYWVCMNGKLRRYIREYIKKLRKIREKVKSGTLSEEQMPFYIERDEIYTNNIRVAWSQLEAMRQIFIGNVARTKIKKENREKNG